MPISLPSLDVLKTFVVVAQRLNFTHAARELHLTQGAVSRQILGLEQRLGYPLFSRQARGLALTPQGAQLLAPAAGAGAAGRGADAGRRPAGGAARQMPDLRDALGAAACDSPAE